MHRCTPSEADLSGSTFLRAQGVTLRKGGDTQMMGIIMKLFDTLIWTWS